MKTARRQIEPFRAHERRMQLAHALRYQQRLELRYRDASGDASARELDPFGLSYSGEHWLLMAHCLLRSDFRTFRVDRIEDLLYVDEPADSRSPPGFSTRQSSSRTYAPDGTGLRASVRLTGAVARTSRPLFPAAIYEYLDDGVVLCHLRASNLGPRQISHSLAGVEAIRRVRGR